jgi:hypothetical protein
MNPNTTWSNLLESYHPYLTSKKFQKNPQTYCVHNTLLKSEKNQFVYLRPLGFKFLEPCKIEMNILLEVMGRD